jgi:hypothetical protein
MNGAKVMSSVSSALSDGEKRNDSQCLRISLRNNITWLWIIIITVPCSMKRTGLKLILYLLQRHSRGPTRAHTAPRSWHQDNHVRKGWGYARVWQRRPPPSTDNVGHCWLACSWTQHTTHNNEQRYSSSVWTLSLLLFSTELDKPFLFLSFES